MMQTVLCLGPANRSHFAQAYAAVTDVAKHLMMSSRGADGQSERDAGTHPHRGTLPDYVILDRGLPVCTEARAKLHNPSAAPSGADVIPAESHDYDDRSQRSLHSVLRRFDIRQCISIPSDSDGEGSAGYTHAMPGSVDGTFRPEPPNQEASYANAAATCRREPGRASADAEVAVAIPGAVRERTCEYANIDTADLPINIGPKTRDLVRFVRAPQAAAHTNIDKGKGRSEDTEREDYGLFWGSACDEANGDELPNARGDSGSASGVQPDVPLAHTPSDSHWLTLVGQVRAWQKRSRAHKEIWHHFVQTKTGSTLFNPNCHDEATLMEFTMKACKRSVHVV